MEKYNISQKMYEDVIQQGIYIRNRLDEFVMTHLYWITNDEKAHEEIVDSLIDVENIICRICNKINDRIELISENLNDE